MTRMGRAFGPGSRRTLRTALGLGAAVSAIALTGCGGSSHAAPDAKVLNDSGAQVSASVKAQERAAHLAVTRALQQSGESKAKYGTVPAYLPKQKLPDDRILAASAGHPALSVQGEAVKLSLGGHDSVLANAVGPNVPPAVQGTGAEYTPVTFQVTFAQAHGSIPLSQGEFKVTDEIGQTVQPKVTLLGGGALPRTIPAGKPLTLQVDTLITAGDGKVVFTPSGTKQYVAAWDFSLEDD